MKYLAQTFRYPITMLAAMYDTGAVISGSRGLEHFVKDSTTERSDWDIYVPGFKESVVDMVRVLSLSGVKWDERPPYAELEEDLTAMEINAVKEIKPYVFENIKKLGYNSRDGSYATCLFQIAKRYGGLRADGTIRITPKGEDYIFSHVEPRNPHLNTWGVYESGVSESMAKLILLTLAEKRVTNIPQDLFRSLEYSKVPELRLLWERYAQALRSFVFSVKRVTSSEFDVCMSASETPNLATGLEESNNVRGEDYGNLDILFGKVTTHSGAEQKVQLMVGVCYGNIRGSFDIIRAFWASHVQCFIGGWCKLHMYYNTASEKKSFLWRLRDGQNPKKVQRAIEKYRKRGFIYIPPEEGPPKQRRAGDDDTRFVDYGEIFRPFIQQRQHVAFLRESLQERRLHLEASDWTQQGRNIRFGQTSLEAAIRSHDLDDLKPEPEKSLANILSESMAQSEHGNELVSTEFRSCVGQSRENTLPELKILEMGGGVRGSLQDALEHSWVF